MGARPAAPGGPTSFKPARLPARGLDLRGLPAGVLAGEKPPQRGEARLPLEARVLDAVRELSEEIDREPLPRERRDEIRRYYDLLLSGAKALPETPLEGGGGAPAVPGER